MIPELGHFALILALILALVQAFYGLAGAGRNDPVWLAVVRPAAWGQFAFTGVAFLALSQAFWVNDFSVLYVAENSNSALPEPYRLAAVWGAHEGSLLLWSLILGAWTCAVAFFSRSLPVAFASRVLGILGLISIGFFLFMLLTSNPFERLMPAAPDGRDLNPLLQDPGLIIHPPMLYIGYVGFSVAFAFAVAALLGGDLHPQWARWARPWTTVAWLFLTVGIALGSWWAYYELGWGGWWFWDPVENASFMPWLVGTALIHSLAVTEKRGAFISWTVLLAIAAFSLSLLGTFLVRSGVLVSVHAFATDPARGTFILLFLALVIGGALALYAWRAPQLPAGGGFKAFSRETFLLINNILLMVAAGAVLLGTLYPLFLDALDMGKISVGPPYFNAVFVPFMLILAACLGIGPYVRWKKDQPLNTARRLRGAAVAAVVLAIGITVIAGGVGMASAVAGIAAGCWALATALLEPLSRWRRGASMPLAILGMSAAHCGVGLVVLGVTVVTVFGIQRDIPMRTGEQVEVAGYQFEFLGTRSAEGANYSAVEGAFRVTQGGDAVTVLFPQKRTYRVQTSPMTEAAIDAGLFRDLYVALGDPVGENTWSVRLQYKPMVRFIWLGALVMALGGVLAAVDRRYRRPRETPAYDAEALPQPAGERS